MIGVGSALVDAARRAAALATTRSINIANYAIFPLVGGVLIHAVVGRGRTHGEADGAATSPLVVLVVFMVTNFLNFRDRGLLQRTRRQAPVHARACGRSTSPCFPSEFATGLLTAGVAFSYGQIGVGAVGLLAVVLFVFQYLLRAGIQALERGEELAEPHS